LVGWRPSKIFVKGKSEKEEKISNEEEMEVLQYLADS
jgi:hypothetical protein